MNQASTPEGFVIIDKPSGWTSHDVVARMRRIAHTRRVGHAGTLDPMATGVLVIAVGRLTRLLGHIQGFGKTYEATIRLGQTTVSDDAEGDITGTFGTGHITDDEIASGISALRGPIEQIPSKVSAIKVGGKRAHAMVRAGEEVALAARPVTISRFDLLRTRRSKGFIDLDVTVSCSSGTYIRALARDLGAGLGCGGHLTMLRRTAVGPFTIDDALTLEQAEADLELMSAAAVTSTCFTVAQIDVASADHAVNGRPVPGVFGEPGELIAAHCDGVFVGLCRQEVDSLAPSAIFATRADLPETRTSPDVVG